MAQIYISSLLRSAIKTSKKDISKEIFNFLKENPNPTDAQVHTFAEEKKINVNDLEKEIYKLATKYVLLMSGGLAANKGISEKEVDEKQLKKGIKVEQEHIKDPDVARKITLDHLAEIPNYYDLLEKMEKTVH